MDNPNIDLKQTTEIKCDECGSLYFEEVVMLRKLSKFVTGAPKDSVIPVPVIRCADCKHVNDEFKPDLD